MILNQNLPGQGKSLQNFLSVFSPIHSSLSRFDIVKHLRYRKRVPRAQLLSHDPHAVQSVQNAIQKNIYVKKIFKRVNKIIKSGIKAVFPELRDPYDQMIYWFFES